MFKQEFRNNLVQNRLEKLYDLDDSIPDLARQIDERVEGKTLSAGQFSEILTEVLDGFQDEIYTKIQSILKQLIERLFGSSEEFIMFVLSAIGHLFDSNRRPPNIPRLAVDPELEEVIVTPDSTTIEDIDIHQTVYFQDEAVSQPLETEEEVSVTPVKQTAKQRRASKRAK